MSMEEFKIEMAENSAILTIEGKDYFIRESYIVKGTGYTFGVFNTAAYKFKDHCINVFNLEFGSSFVVFAKNKNYLVSREKPKPKNQNAHLFKFDIKPYDKYVLTFNHDPNMGIYWIEMGDEKLIGFGPSKTHEHFFKKEIQRAKDLLRHDKLLKIENQRNK